MRVLDLFAGIGGFTLGLERAGFETVAFCEIDPYAQKVLKKNWPGVPIYDDVRTITAERLASDGIGVDVITGGFPCQDISSQPDAKRGIGEANSVVDSGQSAPVCLGSFDPDTPSLKTSQTCLTEVGDIGLSEYSGTFPQVGYDAEWHCIPASELGAHHHRDRIWIIAYPSSVRHGQCVTEANTANGTSKGGVEGGSVLADTKCRPRWNYGGLEASQSQWPKSTTESRPICEKLTDTTGQAVWWSEPDVGRVAHGIPSRSHRLKCLGNAVVPPIPELIGRAINGHR